MTQGNVQQMFLAKALYDNVAEAPDELAFRRGDVVTVLDQNTGGLEGWWLCTLRGRRGIAPGNRLKILSGMVEGDVSLDCTHQHPATSAWRRSLEKSPNKVVTPVKKGDIYLYKQPDRSMEDYDVPPSRYFPPSKEPSPEPGHEIYDTPTSLPAVPTAANNNDDNVYDTPPSSHQLCSLPGSQRVSMDSLSSACSQSRRASSEGGQQLFHTAPSSRRVSVESSSKRLSGEIYDTPPGSKRSSMERILSEDQPVYDTPSSGARCLELPAEATYDTPPASSRRQSRDSSGACCRGSVVSSASSESGISGSASNLGPGGHPTSQPGSARSSLDASLHDPYDLPPGESRALKQLSMDSGLGLYDPSRPHPPHLVPSSSHSHLADCGREDRLQADIKRSRSLEHAVDDIYDSPRNNTPKVSLKSSVPALASASTVSHDPNALYDIPPQVVRDSVISARSDSSDDSVRLSSCSTDSRSSSTEYAGLADNVYAELLLDLDSAVELLVKRQQDVSRASARLLAFVSPSWRSKQSLQTHVYDIKVASGELKKTLSDLMEFAQGTLANSVRVSDKALISRLVKLISPLQQRRKALSAALRSLEDMKWQVALLADVPEKESESPDDLDTMMSLAKDLTPEVKKLASFIQSNSSVLFKRSADLSAASTGSSEDSHVVSKPPKGPKPEGLVKSGGGSGVGVVIQRPRSVQQRPLPPPPVALSDRPLPPTPRDLQLVGTLDRLSDYMNLDGRRRQAEEDDDGDGDYSDLQQDYDYVQLDACDEKAQLQSQQQQQKPGLKHIEQEAETPSAPPPSSEQKSLDTESKVESSEPDHKEDFAPDTDTTDSSDVTDKHADIDTIPTKEYAIQDVDPPQDTAQTADTQQHASQNIHQQQDSSGAVDCQPGAVEGVKTPLSEVNGVNIADTNTPSSYVDLGHTALSPNDKQVLVYYSGQLETHSTLLTNAIDAFFNCIENNEPPKVFISNSKFVIVTAHKLVYISDALHRNLINTDVRNKVMHCANHMCECLKVSVQATKTAALQYPSVPAVQEMVDRVVDVSHAAHELKLVITQASAL